MSVEPPPTFEVSVADDPAASSAAEDEEVKELLKHKPPLSPFSQQQANSPVTSTSTSPTPSTESESSSVAEGTTVQRPSPPPCSLRERVSQHIFCIITCMCVHRSW